MVSSVDSARQEVLGGLIGGALSKERCVRDPGGGVKAIIPR